MKHIKSHIIKTAALLGISLMLPINIMEASAFKEAGERRSGAPIAGFSILLDRYYTSLSEGKLPQGIQEELEQAVGLTQKETGYISVLDIYHNLGVANVSGYLNIRNQPSGEGEIIGKLTRFGGCEILEEENGWYRISSGNVEGYVSASHIATGKEAKRIASEAASLTVRVDTEALRIRTEPNTESTIWNNGYQGESFEVVNDLKNGWVEVKLDGDDAEEGKTAGFVYTPENATLMYTLPQAVSYSENHMEEQAQSALRQSVVDYAMQFLGNPYVWGGTNPNTGSDCSGFVQYILKNSAGVKLNRTSRDQSRQGAEISSKEMRPGDLIFYGNNKGSINHVSLYIGDDQVIHSASKKTGVKISKWNYRTPVTIRNMLED